MSFVEKWVKLILAGVVLLSGVARALEPNEEKYDKLTEEVGNIAAGVGLGVLGMQKRSS
jgi:hypothetical protein